MLLFLAFCAFLLGTSLAHHHPDHQQPEEQECCHAVMQRLEALTKEVENLKTAFYSVHNARSFGSGSERLFVTNGKEGNFDAANITCIQAKGYLPSPKNEAENNALVKTLERHNKSAYLGHISAGYSNWASGEPSSAKGAKTCTKIDRDGQWRATSCEEQLLITCEFSFI